MKARRWAYLFLGVYLIGYGYLCLDTCPDDPTRRPRDKSPDFLRSGISLPFVFAGMALILSAWFLLGPLPNEIHRPRTMTGRGWAALLLALALLASGIVPILMMKFFPDRAPPLLFSGEGLLPDERRRYAMIGQSVIELVGALLFFATFEKSLKAVDEPLPPPPKT